MYFTGHISHLWKYTIQLLATFLQLELYEGKSIKHRMIKMNYNLLQSFDDYLYMLSIALRLNAGDG